MTTLYVAGPMTGLPEFNYPAFHDASEQLVNRGYAVLNPARRGVDDAWAWSDYLRHALRDVTRADGVALLDGWWRSRGARLEHHVAVSLGMPCESVEWWRDRHPMDVLPEAVTA